ncbi:hypothetical protein [Paenibacillus sacheonensis]|uniref:Aminoglycoside phosphotransferase domain-containing protein n=1 Tax=Paenibacillus sacheonensis TaxID=742054 RepID=A0A7X4YSU2_9BACL|nr:hypothetical protein [Paenibacillus sacheonensis]MBM7569506.1 hypothetical protein [Paenibacillus sacheonensis]NBC71903.1 hypothetical protein [Paenibacillus sacheonensis]
MTITNNTVDEFKVDPAYLQSLLRRIVSSKCLQLLSWSCSLLGKNKGESSVYRVSCTILDNDVEQNYALIIKILKPDYLRNHVDHYYYWKREALVYHSGILSQLPLSIRAPLCHAVEEHPDESLWIWLEDIAIEAIQCDWSFAHMCKISYLLGKYNGVYITGTHLPNESFLCRSWIRSWVEVCAAYAKPIEEQKNIWNSCLEDFNANSSMWGLYHINRNRVNSLLETIELLPRVFAHQDVHWDNIFIEQVNGIDTLLAIDWQFASISGVGEELGRMFGYALIKNKIPVNKVEEYKEELFQNYLQGLRDQGWDGNSKLVRFGFIASASLRFIMVMDKLISNLEEDDRKNQKEKSRHLLLVAQALLELAEESWKLRSELR